MTCQFELGVTNWEFCGKYLLIKSSSMVCRKAEKARLGVDSSTDDASDYKIFKISL